MKTKNKVLFYFAISIVLFSCAQISSPTGGKSDTKAPVVKEAIPENKSLNFNAKKVHIEFDEYIQLSDLNSQLVISPPLKKTPEFKIRGKQIVFEIKDTLKPNTTYTFNFGNAIADITESNKIVDFQYVFSTGSTLDSLFIKGKIKDAYKNELQKGFVVLLYKTDEIKSDSFASKQQPSYFAKSDEKGVFTIKNLAKGNYKLVALKDANANYLFDNPEEEIAFLSDDVFLKSNIIDTTLFSFKEEAKKVFVKSAAADVFGKVSIIINKSYTDFKIEELVSTANFKNSIQDISKTKDSITLWLPNQTSDSLFLKIIVDNNTIDTAKIRLQKKNTIAKVNGRGKGSSFSFEISSNISPNVKDLFDLEKPVVLKFKFPIKQHTVEKIILTKRGKPVAFTSKFTDNNNCVFELNANLLADSSYKLYLPKACFTDVFDLTNDSVVYTINMQKPDNYGKVKLEIIAPQKNYILQFLTKDNKVISETAFVGNFTFTKKNVLPASYTIKIIEDSNANLHWDTGNLYKKRQAEKVYFFSKPLDVRANWDLEEKWTIE